MRPPVLEYAKLEICQNDRIALLKYNRPSSGNSLHPKFLRDVVTAMQWIERESSIRVVVVTGEGRFFCTGMELLDTEGMSFEIGSDFHELNRIFITSKKILIAAVNGPAAGYGTSSLALFDLVYAVPDAYFFTPFVKWGMAAEGASSVSFPKIMGHQRASLLFIAGDRITAQEARDVGLVSKVLSKKDFLPQVMQIAQKIADSPPVSLRTTKELMKAPVRKDLLDANDRECTVIHNERYGFAEFQDAVSNFKIEQQEKRRLKSKI
ncbi:ClpP/crotonase-like domain-containing protein [Leptodontidium sp. MPI-SDFR-AT-0119]|nr:ClpP/crotonase-like domain-containing protein [Leptodontidium sp. MPI-SDFR-AT-0119]